MEACDLARGRHSRHVRVVRRARARRAGRPHRLTMPRTRILVGPAVGDRITLESLVARLAHYLAHVDVERIEIAVTRQLLDDSPLTSVTSPSLPRGFDA